MQHQQQIKNNNVLHVTTTDLLPQEEEILALVLDHQDVHHLPVKIVVIQDSEVDAMVAEMAVEMEDAMVVETKERLYTFVTCIIALVKAPYMMHSPSMEILLTFTFLLITTHVNHVVLHT